MNIERAGMISVLVADDDEDWRSILCLMLEAYAKVQVVAQACDGATAIDLALEHRPDAIFLDIDMPSFSGLEVASKLRSLIPHPYLVFQTGRQEFALKAFELEASDYLVKPVAQERLDKCVERMRERLMSRLEKRAAKDLEERVGALEAEVYTDQLVDAYNRRYIDKKIEESIARAKTQGVPLSLLVLDLDYFKSVNDNHGHATGDLVLQQLCQVIQGKLRSEDVLARYGGEEFLVLLRQTNRSQTEEVAERVRKAVEEAKFGNDSSPLQLTASIGGATFCGGDEAHSLFERADKALYEAKTGGRNQVILAENGLG